MATRTIQGLGDVDVVVTEGVATITATVSGQEFKIALPEAQLEDVLADAEKFKRLVLYGP